MDSEPKIGFKKILLIVAGLIALSAMALAIDIDITKQRRSDFISGDFRRIISLSEIFAHGFGIAIALYLVWALKPEKRRWIPRLAACAILPGLACQFIKLFVGRFRPGQYFPNYADSVEQTWVGILPSGQLNFEYVTQSFPSAHAATAIGLCIGLVWMLPQCRVLFISLAMLASIQRVVAGAHWMSDIFAGAAISVLVCGLVFHHRRMNKLFSTIENPKPENQSPAIQISDSEDQPEHSKAA